jgi:hypothetical protein
MLFVFLVGSPSNIFNNACVKRKASLREGEASRGQVHAFVVTKKMENRERYPKTVRHVFRAWHHCHGPDQNVSQINDQSVF